MYNEPCNLRVKRANNTDRVSTVDEFHLESLLGAREIQESEDEAAPVHFSYTPMTALGSHYIARLLFSITSRKISATLDTKNALSMRPSKANNLNSNLRKTEFIAYIVINEVTMIDTRYQCTKYQDVNLSFRLSVGEW
jgi:hypothetical protein